MRGAVHEECDIGRVTSVCMAARLAPRWRVPVPRRAAQMRILMIRFARALVEDLRVRRKDRLETLVRSRVAIAHRREMLEVARDMVLVPRVEDRLHVGEVLVQRGATDPRLLGDFRHRHLRHTTLRDQRSRRVQDRAADLAPVGFDCA